MLYNAGIRAEDEKEYRETGTCEQFQFINWLKHAAWLSTKLKKKCFVEFAQQPHTFEVAPSGKMHLLTPETAPIETTDPAAGFLESGD